MTDERLAELEWLCQNATPGPWNTAKVASMSLFLAYERMTACELRAEGASVAEIAKIFKYTKARMQQKFDKWASSPPDDKIANFKFILAARTAVPELLAEVRRLRALAE